jgi:DNA-binding FrmR family transcriptional regulator
MRRAATAPLNPVSPRELRTGVEMKIVVIPPGGICYGLAMVGYEQDKDKLLKRLSRIEGQVRGVSRMVEEERYCIDVLTQISAIEAALDKVALGLIDDHTRHCVVEAEGGERVEKVDELMAALGRFVKR